MNTVKHRERAAKALNKVSDHFSLNSLFIYVTHQAQDSAPLLISHAKGAFREECSSSKKQKQKKDGSFNCRLSVVTEKEFQVLRDLSSGNITGGKNTSLTIETLHQINN